MQNPDEGYIKFSIRWDESPLLPRKELPGLIHYRNQLHQLGLIGETGNQIGFGNISCRLTGEQFIISGTQTGGIKIASENHFCLVESCDPQKNEVTCSGPVKASSEAMSHDAFYKADKNISAVIHIHHLHLWQSLLNKFPTTDPSIAYGTPEMAAEIKKIILSEQPTTGPHLIITAGHREGIFSYGNSLMDAYNNLIKVFDFKSNN